MIPANQEERRYPSRRVQLLIHVVSAALMANGDRDTVGKIALGAPEMSSQNGRGNGSSRANHEGLSATPSLSYTMSRE